MTGILNARTRLDANDTHGASLSGSVDAVDGVNVLTYTITTGAGSSTITNPNVEFVYTSQTLTATKPINKGFIKYTNAITTNSTGSLRSATFRLREDDINGAILSTETKADVGAGGGGNAFTNSSVNITNQPIGTRTYVRTLELGLGIALYGFNGSVSTSVSPITLVSYLVDVDNSQIATLIGENLSKGSSPSGGRAT